MVPHILQVAYYPNLKETRAKILEAAGYRVTSVLVNHDAVKLNRRLMKTADLVLVGFSGPKAAREAVVRWIKRHYADLPVVVQVKEWEKFPEADATASLQDPSFWLAAIANILKTTAKAAPSRRFSR